ncbi:GNAT family N-acetyltransferase [Vibrio diabolicus]|uniref:GNAT family N-acetyltransferase n=1 Tax=Vibrio diabolicus TaxID=50719 RepID=UPI00215E98BE|nr:GNAT family N-acetyltransferase [Vibrio diabolicus]MCS0342394.1 GNAT family N-acetyltransferase [Vibrio diabolicus]
MEIAFRQINIDDFELCVAARKDAYFCSFGHYDGFDDFISGYRERVLDRLATSGWFYIHIFVDGQFAGQLEFRSFSPEPETGYVHLIYLQPNFRGSGLAPKVQDYIVSTLSKAGCVRAVLSVSRTNHRALTFYKRHGWEFVRKNLKHDETDFYQLWLRT